MVILWSLLIVYLAILNAGEKDSGGFPGWIFSWCGGVAFLLGVLRKVVRRPWCFGGALWSIAWWMW
jgi:hypothetical protein